MRAKLTQLLAIGAATVLLMVAYCARMQVRAAGPSAPSEPQYLSPSEMAFSPDGRSLYVVCERSDQLLVLNSATGVVKNRIAVGHIPRGLAVSPDGARVYVANSWDDTVSVINVKDSSRSEEFATGWEPISVVLDRSGKTLYVANRVSNDISLIEAATGHEIKRLSAGRGASYLALSPDGTRIYCTHVYPRIAESRTPPESEITVIDTARQTVVDRLPLNNVAGMFHVALSADGRFGVVAQMRPKNLVPLAHVEHGFVFGYSLTLFGSAVGAPVQVPLDELDRYYSLPYGIALSPDRIYVASAGSDIVTAIDTRKLLTYSRQHRDPFINDLSAASHYVSARIPVGHNPRGLLLSPDGKRLYVANRMDDTLAVIDTVTNKVATTLDLGGSRKLTALRQGEQLFDSSRFAFQGQFSCANCHIDYTFDGLTWDLEPDGFGKDIVDNRLLEDIRDTEPFKWNGGNPNLPTECGPRTEKYFYRSQSYSPQELADIVLFVRSLPLRPNRSRLALGALTPAQERGKAIFAQSERQAR